MRANHIAPLKTEKPGSRHRPEAAQQWTDYLDRLRDNARMAAHSGFELFACNRQDNRLTPGLGMSRKQINYRSRRRISLHRISKGGRIVQNNFRRFQFTPKICTNHAKQ